MKTEQEMKDQLQAKEQECEELKIQVCRCSEGWGKAECEKNLYQQIEQEKQEQNFNLKMQVSKYEQVLDEIKGLSQSTLDEFENDDEEQQLLYCKQISEQILYIINKTKDDE